MHHRFVETLVHTLEVAQRLAIANLLAKTLM